MSSDDFLDASFLRLGGDRRRMYVWEPVRILHRACCLELSRNGMAASMRDIVHIYRFDVRVINEPHVIRWFKGFNNILKLSKLSTDLERDMMSMPKPVKGGGYLVVTTTITPRPPIKPGITLNILNRPARYESYENCVCLMRVAHDARVLSVREACLETHRLHQLLQKRPDLRDDNWTLFKPQTVGVYIETGRVFKPQSVGL